MSQLPAFLTTVHDPDGRLLRGFEDVGKAISAYRGVFAFATENTDRRVIETLRGAVDNIEIGPAGAPGVGQRSVLATAAQNVHHDMFYCDFDRWLHWAAFFPKELIDLPARVRKEHSAAWYICLGRSERAIATHPEAQRYPEAMTNTALQAVAGTCLDATAGAAWIRESGARLILEGSVATSKAIDLEWPALVLRADPERVRGMFFEGLEFETPDGYAEEIAALGSVEAWIRATYDNPRVLRDRLQLAVDSISALVRVMGDSPSYPFSRNHG